MLLAGLLVLAIWQQVGKGVVCHFQAG
jgi:hypothetical protein